MSVFKNLNLKYENIIPSINNYPGAVFKEQKGNNIIVVCDSKEVLLSVWLKADGTTTINPKVGNNQEVSLEIAQHIVKECKYSDARNINYSSKVLNEEDFQLILNFLADEIKDVEIKQTSVAHGVQYQIHDKALKDTFTITRYSNGNTHFQGKPLGVYSTLYAILAELISDDDIIKINNETYSVEIDKADVYSELEFLLPTAYDKLCDTTKKILMSSLALRKVEIDLDDYGCFAFGGLRGLEAFMKVVLNKKGYTIPRNNDFGKIFSYDGNRHVVCEAFKRHVNSADTNHVMENCYNFHSQHRHGIFHANNIPMMSRLINKEEADRIINTVCKLIEEGTNEI